MGIDFFKQQQQQQQQQGLNSSLNRTNSLPSQQQQQEEEDSMQDQQDQHQHQHQQPLYLHQQLGRSDSMVPSMAASDDFEASQGSASYLSQDALGSSGQMLQGGGGFNPNLPLHMQRAPMHAPRNLWMRHGQVPSRKVFEFEELFELGRGNFGSVSCCRKRTDGVLYAIKRQDLERMDTAQRKAAQREIFALGE